MSRFVCVRVTQANRLDLSLFQFDYDLTFAAFFLNADKTIYGRFGTRSDRDEAARHISVEGFRRALVAALKLHAGYPGNKASVAGKHGAPARFAEPEAFESLRRYRFALDFDIKKTRNCIHCHMVGDAVRNRIRAEGRPLTDELIYPWPLPEVVGLRLDPAQRAGVAGVTAGSPASKAGFRAGDDVLSLEGQSLVSIADFQWVLHNAADGSEIIARVRRGESIVTLRLLLPGGWRRKGDIAWRTTTRNLRRMASGGLVLEELTAAERKALHLAAERLALKVTYVGQSGAHSAAKWAGFEMGDIIIGLDGKRQRRTEAEFLAYGLRYKKPGEHVSVTVMRRDEQLELQLPMQ